MILTMDAKGTVQPMKGAPCSSNVCHGKTGLVIKSCNTTHLTIRIIKSQSPDGVMRGNLGQVKYIDIILLLSLITYGNSKYYMASCTITQTYRL